MTPETSRKRTKRVVYRFGAGLIALAGIASVVYTIGVIGIRLRLLDADRVAANNPDIVAELIVGGGLIALLAFSLLGIAIALTMVYMLGTGLTSLFESEDGDSA